MHIVPVSQVTAWKVYTGLDNFHQKEPQPEFIKEFLSSSSIFFNPEILKIHERVWWKRISSKTAMKCKSYLDDRWNVIDCVVIVTSDYQKPSTMSCPSWWLLYLLSDLQFALRCFLNVLVWLKLVSLKVDNALCNLLSGGLKWQKYIWIFIYFPWINWTCKCQRFGLLMLEIEHLRNLPLTPTPYSKRSKDFPM